jgi:ADP-ribosyl-[dinitrogen reductase] hydrolase
MSASTAALPPLPLRNCYWVLPGQVLAGEYPGGHTPGRTKQRLERLLSAGIVAFLDLTHPDEMPRYDKDLPFNIDYRRKPIRDHGLPAARVQMIEILDCLQESLSAGRPVYVHCRAGIGRTGIVMGCLLADQRGLTGDQALRELNRLWQQCRRSRSWAFVPETDEQVNYVRGWKSRAKETPARAPSAPANSGASRSGAATSSAGAHAATQPTSRPGAGTHSSASRPSGTDSATAHSARGLRPAATTGTHPSAAARSAAAQATGTHPSASRPTAGAESAAAATITTTTTTDVAEAKVTRTPADAGSASLVYTAAEVAPKPALPRARAPSSPADSDPLLQPDTLSAARGLRDRFIGALVGLAVGDAVAAATQYRRPGAFTPVGDMLGGGPFDLPRGGWSDDTSMALCLAESLLQSNGFDARDQVTRYARWQQDGYLSSVGHCVGITASTARALAMSKWRRQVFAGSHDPKLLDPEPLSRIGSVVLFSFSSLEAAVQQAADAARTTCQAPAVLDDCRTLARALHAALSGQPKASVVAGTTFPSGSAAQRTATSTGCLHAAFWAFASTDSYRDAILRAANLGGNSDVVTAVCGQLAGAWYGVVAIPAPWRNSLMQHDLIESYGDRLLTQCLLSLGS